MNTKLKEIISKADDVIVRYPMVLVMAIIGATNAAVFFQNIDNHEIQNFEFVKMILTSCLGISVMFGLNMLSQRIGKRFLLEFFGVLFLIGFYFILPKTENNFTVVYAFIILPIVLLSHLFVSFSAFLKKTPSISFWQFNKNLLINSVLTAIFTGVFVGGIMLAILAIDHLFDLHLKFDIYGSVFYGGVIFASCFIFLLFNEKGLYYLEKDSSYPEILKFFTQFILIPLLLIYAIILYVYSTKILINWELPRGWVTYLVLAYSIIGILALLLVYPLKEVTAKSRVKIFSKIFYFTLIPLLVLLFVAIFTRILEYGYTEARYFVLLLAIWLTVVIFYFLFWKKSNIKLIPISLFGFGVFALVFPYFNAFSIAKRSQEKALQKILTENHLLKNGKIDFTTNVPLEIADEIANKMGFLAIRKDKAKITSYLNNDMKNQISKLEGQNLDNEVQSTVRNAFSNVNNTIEDGNNFRLELVSERKIHQVMDYQYVSAIRDYYNDEVMINKDQILINKKLDEQNKVLTISLNNEEKVDLMPLLRKKLGQNRLGEVEVPEISVETDLGKYHVKILFSSLSREIFNKNQENINFGNALVLIKKK